MKHGATASGVSAAVNNDDNMQEYGPPLDENVRDHVAPQPVKEEHVLEQNETKTAETINSAKETIESSIMPATEIKTETPLEEVAPKENENTSTAEEIPKQAAADENTSHDPVRHIS